MSESNARDWEGDDGWSVFDKGLTDYWRAGAINGYAGIIRGRFGNILVLGDLAEETTWIGNRNESGGILLRWVGADSDDHILDGLKKVSDDQYEDPGLIFEVVEQNHILFDSVYPGAEAMENPLALDEDGNQYGYKSLDFKLRKGNYKVRFLFLDSKDLMLISIKLDPICEKVGQVSS